MEEVCMAVQEPLEMGYKHAEADLKEMRNDVEEDNSLLHRDLIFMNMAKIVDIKEEDYSWESVDGQLHDSDMKEEDCESAAVSNKDPEPISDTKGMKNNKPVNGIEEGSVKSEAVSQYVCSRDHVPGSSFTPSGPFSIQNHSVQVKSKALASDVKRPKRVSYLKRKQDFMAPFRTWIDNEGLIKEVRRRPHLHDLAHQHYKDRDKRLQAWHEISQLLTPDWAQMSIAQQRSRVNAVKTRWRTIKDNFLRQVRQIKETGGGSAAGTAQTILRFKELRFLLPIVEGASAFFSFDTESMEGSKSSPYAEEDGSITTNGDSMHPSAQTSEATAVQVKEGEREKTQPKENNQKTAANDVMGELVTIMRGMADRSENELCSDFHFCMSIVPLMKEVPRDRVLDMRSDMLNVIKFYTRSNNNTSATAAPVANQFNQNHHI
ncbi:uncharacterized protein LOC114666675 [Erpetoichthys calabaricus]|uniref:uncharacterized protein LOC114666675 n=1 Tax=Erpetoichthys calabaricus TaxID=27687 RepID=UPI002233FA71|nr:uncharacterized protein LOC114666675 [Erpetoichthys calabaricus]